ncbi:MAG: hypothetical protein GX100_02015 [candidate division WS1 bacterium]|nr:hypothetical protein [candidate division WS1 bacterium]
MPKAPQSLHKLALCAAVVCCLAELTPAHADFLDSIEKALDRAGLFQGLQISGQNSFTLQRNFLQGSQASFEGQRWDTGDLLRQSSIHLEGPIWKEFGFRADISDSGYGRAYTNWVVGYVGHDTALYYGNLNVSLMGNQFASFGRTLQGWQLDQRLPNNGLMRAFYSHEKGHTQNQAFLGNNTAGPYFLTYTPIIEGSLRVKVDERAQELGTDYRVDYQSGELWFQPFSGPPKIIPSTSTISVSYQSAGYGSSPSTLSGVRAEMPIFKRRGLVGATFLRQQRPRAGQGDTAGHQEDIYQGSGTTGPFDTNYRPILADGTTVVYKGQSQTISTALVVLVDNALQTEGLDYDSYRDIGRIIFRRLVPPTALVRIQYYYSLGADVSSPNLQVTGLDLSYRLSPEITLATQFAQSEGGGDGGGGSALSGLLTFSRPGLQFSAEYLDMSPSFRFMDSSGFYTQQSGFGTNLYWRPSKYLSLEDSFSSMRSATGLSFGYSGYGGDSYLPSVYSAVATQQATEPDEGLSVDTLRHSLSVRHERPGWPTVMAGRSFMSNSALRTGNSSYQTDTLQIAHDFGRRLRGQAQWQVNTQEYSAPTTSTSALLSGSRSHMNQYALTWIPSDTLSFSANLSTTRTAGRGAAALASNQASSSDSVQFSARWAPSDRLSLNLDHTSNVSRGAVTSGLYTYPAAWPHALTVQETAALARDRLRVLQGDNTTEVVQLQDDTTNLALTYQVSNALSCGLSLGRHKYNTSGGIGYLANSLQDTRNLFFTWRFSPAMSLTSSFGTDRLNYLDEGRGEVTNNTYSASVNYQPSGSLWGTGITFSRQTGSSPTYINFGNRQGYVMVDTDLTDVSGQVRYQLAEKASAFANMNLSDFVSGFSAFNKQTAEVGLEHQLSNTSRLAFSYRLIRNLAGTPSSPLYAGMSTGDQNYQAHTFGFTLTTSFGSGGSGEGFNVPSGGYGSSYTGAEAYGTFGGLGTSGAATFGGYQTSPGFSTTSGVFANAGLGTPGFASGRGDDAGFSARSWSPEQGRDHVPASSQPPALDWSAAGSGESRAEASAPPTSSTLDTWEEGLSRWDFGTPGEWW